MTPSLCVARACFFLPCVCVPEQGMKLTSASKSKNMLDSLIKEDHLVSIPSKAKASAGGAEAAVPAAVVAASVHPVSLSVEERLSCQVWTAVNFCWNGVGLRVVFVLLLVVACVCVCVFVC